MKRLLAALAVGGLALAACKTVGPDYRVPKAAAINAPAARGAFAGAQGDHAVTQGDLPDRWWRLYDDPRLDGLITAAFAANTDLRVAEANLERSRAALAEARAARRPNLTFNLDTSFAQVSAEQYLQPEVIPAAGLYDVGLTLAYQLDLFGRIRRGVEAAGADDEAVEAARDLVRVNVAGEVTRAYVDVCATGAELAAARRSLALQQRALALTERLRRAGRAVSLDVIRGQAQVEQFRANVPALLARQRAAELRLAVLAGRPPAAFDRSLDACAAPPALRQPIPVGDGAALLARRPDVREAERRLAASTATIGVRIAALYPQVSLGASAGSTGAIESVFSAATRRFGFGPNVVWRLDHSADRARIRQAEAQARADLARFDGTVLRSLQEVEAALNTYAHDLDRRESLRAARDRAAQAFRDAQRLQAAGRTAAFTTLDAERTFAAAESAVAASDTQVGADQVALFLSLGGGWRNAEEPGSATNGGGAGQGRRHSGG